MSAHPVFSEMINAIFARVWCRGVLHLRASDHHRRNTLHSSAEPAGLAMGLVTTVGEEVVVVVEVEVAAEVFVIVRIRKTIIHNLLERIW